jgi:N utilization substance protein A
MAEIKLSINEMGFIATFQNLTKTTPRDCIINETGITYIISPKEMGLAIGKDGSHIKDAQRALKKEVSVVEYSEDPVKFISNVMYPIRPKNINIEGKDSKKVAKVSVEKRDRAAAIGSKGKNIHRTKKIVARHHDINDVIII